MANSFEDLAEQLGVKLSSVPPTAQTETEVTSEQPTEMETAEESEVLLQNTETESVAETVEQTVEQTEEQTEVDSEQTVEQPVMEEESEYTFSEEERNEFVLTSLSEMLGREFTSVESLMEILNKEQKPEIELDPTVKVIADFVKETGRSVSDWFTYQSFNPSEMDDSSVIKLQLMNQYPDLSEEDAQLLLSNRYKTDEDEFSENEVRIGKLNLKMDAQKARTELTQLRESYKAPVAQQTQQVSEEVESPITEDWINAMSKTVDEIESLELEIGKDKNFSFNLEEGYKQTLKSKNAKLDEFFDQYVDEKGGWDFDMLSAHRAIVDNIDEIAKAIYAQGLSDGQSKVVKNAVNPSAPSPKGQAVDAPSSEDKVRQQVLNALQGGDNALRIKF